MYKHMYPSIGTLFHSYKPNIDFIRITTVYTPLQIPYSESDQPECSRQCYKMVTVNNACASMHYIGG